jgi:hypothetical protein
MCEATGRLVLTFAQIETVLSAGLRFNLSNKVGAAPAGNPTGIAAAVYGSMRFKAARDTINRLVHEEGALTERQTEVLGAMFEHIAHIANLRDKLAHQYATNQDDGGDVWLLSDSFTTRRFHARQTWRIAAIDVHWAALDLAAARRIFMNNLGGGVLFKKLPETPPTWRYKPTALEPLDPEIARALLGLPPQSQSSGG